MTLNITVLTPTVIYQSADFRLTDPSNGSLITDTSAKTVVLQYQNWSGFVTYTGLGAWEGKNISELIADWLGDQTNRSMAEVADHLQRNGTSLLNDVRRRAHASFAHTFTLAGFEDGAVRAFVVSNFEDCYGMSSGAIEDRLTVTFRELRSWSPAAVIVTGQPKAVPAIEKRILRKLAEKNPDDGGLIRRRLQDLNAVAAASNTTISQDCAVISFRSDGYGVLQLSDTPGSGPRQIPSILNGVNIAKFAEDAMGKLGINMSTMQMTNATFVSTNNPGPPRALQSSCTFPVGRVDSSGGYEINEITGADFEPMSAEDINEVGHVVGTGREEMTVPWTKNIPWLMRGGQVYRLNYDGFAYGISDDDQIAAMLQGGEGERAALYTNGSIRVFSLSDADGSSNLGTNSSIAAISGDGIVAGYVRTETGVPGENNMRAAVFQKLRSPMVLTEVAALDGVRELI